jgi:hypothetical protein
MGMHAIKVEDCKNSLKENNVSKIHMTNFWQTDLIHQEPACKAL